MARQGSLCQPICSSRWLSSALRYLCVAIFIQANVVGAASPESDQVDLGIRYQWETPNPQFWNVSLRVIDENGPARAISELENHCDSPRTTGAFDVSANEMDFRPRYPLEKGSVRLRVRASRDAKIAIQIQSSTHRDLSEPSQVTREISVLELIESDSLSENEENEDGVAQKQSWSLSRVVDDVLRVDQIDESKYHQPGSEFHFRVRANHWHKFSSQRLSLQYSLVRVDSNEVVLSRRWPLIIDSLGNSEVIEIRDQAPAKRGVYEVRCEVAKDDENIWSRFRRRETPLRRVGHPIVVLPDAELEQSTANSSHAWETVGTLRPSESSWSVGQWLPEQTTRLIPGQVVSNQPELPVQGYAGETLSLIGASDAFQATLPVMKPGYPHRVTLRVPNDRSTNVRVEIAPPHGRSDPILSFAIVADPDPSQGKWTSHTFVHYPRGTDDQIWLTNLDGSTSFAFESVEVVAGPSELSPQYPLTTNRSAALRVTDSNWVDAFSKDVAIRGTLHDCASETLQLYRTWVAARRLCDYAAANGMSGVVLPANANGNAIYHTSMYHPIHSDDESLTGLMWLLKKPGFHVHVALKPDMLLSSMERRLRENVSMTGTLTRAHLGASDQYNVLHPLVQEELVGLVQELHQQCLPFENYHGVVLVGDNGSHLQLRRNADKDPAVLMQFAQASKRIAGPQMQRWVENEGKGEFSRWVEKRTANVFNSIASKVPEKSILVTAHMQRGEMGHHQPNLLPIADFQCGGSRSPASQPTIQQQNSVSAVVAASISCAAQGTAQEEVEFVRTRIGKDVCQVIDRAGPSLLMIDHGLLSRRLDPELKQLLASMADLPAQGQMTPVKPSDPAAQTVHVSSGVGSKGHLFLLVTNLAPWTSEVEMAESGVKWSLVGSETDADLESVGSRIRLTLPAGQLAVLKSMEPVPANKQLSTWSVRLGGGVAALDQIKTNVTAIVERIGTLADLDPSGTLRNGGFEQSGGMGLVGWLHAQHPPGCVQIDQNVAHEGKHSVRMTTDESVGTRTWMVSETIDPPKSGRLAVSLACRAEAREDASVHQLRVSIEATQKGAPVRYASEFEVPRDGQWADRAIVLEIEEIDSSMVGSLRLTIDSLSGGQVWVDDVRLHEEFPTTKERTELQGQAFLAVQGLQRGNLTASARLLQNDWARYLLALGPTEKPKPVEKKRSETTVEAPGVAERIRSWLPRPLRF